MEKRYQVFVSSTYDDLHEERTEVIQALLELDCFPSGMEMFPASTGSQWNWIKKVIDQSDYYILILAGKYGTISKDTNLGYIEMEYRYAVEIGKPILAFIHENIENLISSKVEKDEDRRKRYNDFRRLVETKLCKKWSSATDLSGKVSRSIASLINECPGVGWVRDTNQGIVVKRRIDIEREEWISLIESTDKIFESFAIASNGYFSHPSFLNAMRKKIIENIDCQFFFYLLDPNSSAAIIRESEERMIDKGELLTTRIINTLNLINDWLFKEENKSIIKNIHIILYDWYPTYTYVRNDTKAYISTYLYMLKGDLSPTIIINTDEENYWIKCIMENCNNIKLKKRMKEIKSKNKISEIVEKFQQT
jgi:hypothetical protein